ncbi:CBS domain-containing protein [Actinomadura viridis]|uniref:CBS domain-containing protein n=1 Tax=Actinomadura viridis TaxID=58110 RepID=A0A931GH04_9ACTN|nr:CBS domain-containing protein [Actinomadura viridis]MBG6086898.1 CBS domain-containing protein [Actinomadura viridis]
MLIGNVYRPMVLSCQRDEPLATVARRMAEKRVGALAVLDGDRVTGIITERDLVGALARSADPAGENAAAYASPHVRTAGLDEDSQEVARRMLDADIRHLPVDDHGRVVGMVSMRDLLALETWAS